MTSRSNALFTEKEFSKKSQKSLKPIKKVEGANGTKAKLLPTEYKLNLAKEIKNMKYLKVGTCY